MARKRKRKSGDRSGNPSAATIRRMTKAIRSGWNKRTERRRAPHLAFEPYRIPVVRVSEFCDSVVEFLREEVTDAERD